MVVENIKLNFDEAITSKHERFTKYHTIFNCTISYNRKRYSFEYQCNVDYNMPNLEEILECLITEASCYEQSRNIQEFAEELGYTIEQAKNPYNECKKTSKALHRLFTDEEISEIEDYLFYHS